MMHLLKIEWLKVKNYQTFWILLLISIVSMPAFNYVIYDLMNNSFPKVNGKSLLGNPFGFPEVWQTVTWNSSLLLLMPAILIITLITNEFTFKTHRQNIIDGWSRMQFINVKLVEILLFSIFLTIIVFLTCLGFGYYGSTPKSGVSIFKDVHFTGYFFVQMISYSMIALLIGMFVKRAGLAMGVFFIYMIGEQFLVSILKTKYEIEKADYFPQEVTDMLIMQPYTTKLLSNPGKIAHWQNQLPVYLAIAALYLVIYCVVVSWRFRKSDI